MDTVISILLKVFGEAWKKLCALLPSPIELSCRQRELSHSHLLLKFYLKNVSTNPIRDYAMTIHLPAEVAKHLRHQNPNPDKAGPLSLSFSGPAITDWHEPSEYQRSRGVSGIGTQAKATDHPLLPAGPPVPVGELDFWIADDSQAVITDLAKYPIELEYWGGTGTRHSVRLFLKTESGNIRYMESRKPFQLSSDPKLLAAVYD